MMIDNLWDHFRSGKPYFIAEAGVNHLGSFDLAERLIREAAEAGAHAIKFQSYKASRLATKDAPRFWDWEGEDDPNGTQHDSYSVLDGFGAAEHAKLKELCKKYDIEFFSTPFDEEAVDYLEALEVRLYKVASCDITNVPLLRKIGSTGKIICLSTGASSLDEIKNAVRILEGAGTNKIVVMHCNLKYPTEDNEANLAMIHSIRESLTFAGGYCPYVFGLSDHTLTLKSPGLAVALGAPVVEKHYTVDKTLDKSADHWLSVDPSEVKQIVSDMNNVYELLGSRDKTLTDSEKLAHEYARRSVVAARIIPKGHIINEDDVTLKRPGNGIPANEYDNVIGKKSTRIISADTVMQWGDVK